MVTDIELAWLAGLWDGEGSITVFTHTEKGGKTKLCPTLCVVNTNETIIAEAARLLDKLGTSFSVFTRTPQKREHKPAIQLATRNMRYIQIVLEAMLPFLIGKKAQAQLVLRYVTKKLSHPTHRGQGSRYEPSDFALQQQVQLLNQRGQPNTSTTTGEDA